MKRSMLFLVAVLFLFSLANTTFAGVPGATDKVRGASLLVPFFEVGISNAQDTLLVVFNTAATTSTIHYHVWDIDGNATDLYGNTALTDTQSWVASMASIIATASAATKNQLTDGTGSFYRGFVTIDLVSGTTTLDPTNGSFPFANSNVLEGVIYYVRLLDGKASGLDMVPLQYFASTQSTYLNDFYQNSDDREEIDNDARKCAETKTVSGAACAHDDQTDRMDFRVFIDPASNAATRLIIFAWDPDETEGVSKYCDANACSSNYPYKRYDEAGVELENTTTRLDHVVNVIDISGTKNGWVSISEIAAPTDFQLYGFAFNSASSTSASTNFEVTFPAYIIP